MLCRRCGLCSRRNRKINIVLGGRGGGGGKCDENAQKSNFTTNCLNTFVAHWLSLNWLTHRVQIIRKKSYKRTSEYLLDKERCITEQIFFSNYFMLVAFSSPVKFSKSVFSVVKSRAKFEVVLQKQFPSVVANHWKSNFSTVNLAARKFVKCIPWKFPQTQQ